MSGKWREQKNQIFYGSQRCSYVYFHKQLLQNVDQ